MKKIYYVSCLVWVTIIFLSFNTYAQINSVQSGNWSDGSVWSGGVVPDSNANVTISTGNIITIDNPNAVCDSIVFADTSSHLEMGSSTSVLNVYGNFALFSATHKVFYAWPDGAKIKFTGSAPVQLLRGWNTAGSSTTFMEMIVDKPAGIVTTAKNNMRFSFGTSLEIINGTFQQDSTDDIETRDLGGLGTLGTITIQTGGIYKMVGGSSHIRKGTFTDTIAARIGKITVYGMIYFASTSTNHINLGGIDVMSGGTVTLSTGWSTTNLGLFNCSLITVFSGGTLTMSTTTNVWHASSSVLLMSGGEFNSTGSAIFLPPAFMYTNGNIRFSKSTDQTIPAALTNFYNLFLSGAGIKTVNNNVNISGTFSLRGTATINLNNFTLTYGPSAVLQYGSTGQISPQTTSDVEFPAVNGPANLTIYNSGGVTLHANRTISGTLSLSGGVFDNNGTADDVSLTLGNNATIRRAAGSLTVAPVLAGTVNLEYYSSVVSDTTGPEIPTSTSALNNLIISSTLGVTLASNIYVNGSLSLTGSNLYTGPNVIHFGINAVSPSELVSARIIGNAVMDSRSVGTGTINFLNSNITGNGDIGNVTITRTTGTPVVYNSNQGINAVWEINSNATPPYSNRNLSLSWFSSDDNGKAFSSSDYASTWQLASDQTWAPIGFFIDVSVSDPRTITIPVLSFSRFTVTDQGSPLLVKSESSIPKTFALSQNFPNPFNPETIIQFDIPKASDVNVSVYSITGKKICTLVNEYMNAGSYQRTFSSQLNGKSLASGTYFYVLNAGDVRIVNKMILLK